VTRQPGGDRAAWERTLAHRPPPARDEISERFVASGVTPGLVRAVLADCGDGLFAALRGGDKDWADGFGGALAVALLAAEVSAFAAHLNSRASAVRAAAVDALLDDFSAVTVAARLGVSRQKVYEVGRAKVTAEFVDRVPWRQP
jgi:hypothetical protein